MEKYTLPDQNSKKEFFSPAPVELTPEQAKQIAGGLAAAVTLINGTVARLRPRRPSQLT